MHDMMEKFLKKKKESPMSDEYKDAKSGKLKELIGEMSKMMAEPLSGMKNLKKVTVAADDKSGLQEGLKKAEHMLESSPEQEDSEEENELSEEEPKSDDYQSMNSDELDQLMQKLMEIKKSKMGM